MEATFAVIDIVKSKLPYITTTKWDSYIEMYKQEVLAFVGNEVPTSNTRPKNASIFDEAFYSMAEKSMIADCIAAMLLSAKGIEILGSVTNNDPRETTTESSTEGSSKYVSKAEAGSVNAEFAPIKSSSKIISKPVSIKDYDLRVAAQTLYDRFKNAALGKASNLGLNTLPFFEDEGDAIPVPFIR